MELWKALLRSLRLLSIKFPVKQKQDISDVHILILVAQAKD